MRCESGWIREEVCQNSAGEIVKYNLAFINHNLYQGDNGRVLGYDNAHIPRRDHRHFKGQVQFINFPGYDRLVQRFFAEVERLRKERA